MGLLDLKRNLSEIANAANEKLQASLSASTGIGQTRKDISERQPHTSNDNNPATKILELTSQIDSLQAEVSRLSEIVSDQKKQLDNLARTIATLDKNKSNGNISSGSENNTIPEDFVKYAKEQFDSFSRMFILADKRFELFTQKSEITDRELSRIRQSISRLSDNVFMND